MSDFFLENKPDFEECINRIEAWYSDGEIIDRPPVQFFSFYAPDESFKIKAYNNQKDKWIDAEYIVDRYLSSIKNKEFLGESFPSWWPNLGPSVYSAFFGGELEYDEATSWAIPFINSPKDLDRLSFDRNNKYYKKILEMTNIAFQMCAGKCYVGYTDIHPNLDCVAGWRNTQDLCMDLYDDPMFVKDAVHKATSSFFDIFKTFNDLILSKNNPSLSWLGTPFKDTMHIPCCDFAAMISSEQFEEFALPSLLEEVNVTKNNIFHIDGIGVAKHLDSILSLPNTKAVQWVQGDGETKPIMQWLPLLKRIREAKKSIMVYLEPNEVDGFIEAIPPNGIMLNIATNNVDEKRCILNKLEKW